MKEYGTYRKSESGTIIFKRLLPGPIERVWKYLTDSEKRGKWLAAGKMELRIGGEVELMFNHENLSEHDDPIPEKYKHHKEGSTMHGRITGLEPPRLLRYTWGEESGEESEVTFELTVKGEKVLLELTHRKLGDNNEILIGVAAGWHTHLGILADNLMNKKPEGFWKVHTKLEEDYKKRLVKG